MYIEKVDFKDSSLGLGIVKQNKLSIIDQHAKLNIVFPDFKDIIIHIMHLLKII